MPPPQGTLSYFRQSRPPTFVLVIVFLLVVFVPLRSPSADPHPSSSNLAEDDGDVDCPEARRWPFFCSALLNTTLLDEIGKRKIQDGIPKAKTFFCDMVRVLNKIDCAQPFTVSPRWRIGCQEAYRDWSCSLLIEGLLPVGLLSCDSTCHQVIRVCPYLSPDRNQADALGKAALHPSQYGGHPAFHCPTTYTDSNHHHTEDYFFRRSTPDPDSLVCILFNPSEAGLGPGSFPLQSLDLRNFSVTYCQDYENNHDDPHPLLKDKEGRVNVSQCCWTYNTALPKTYNSLSSTLRRRELEDENCTPLSKNLHEQNPYTPAPDQETQKQVFLQCLVTQDSPSSSSSNTLIPDSISGYVDYEGSFYVDEDKPRAAADLSRRLPIEAQRPPLPLALMNRNSDGGGSTSSEDDDPTIDRFNSAEGEDYDEDEYETYPPSFRGTSTTEAFLSLIASLDSGKGSNSHTRNGGKHRLSTTTSRSINSWRERRSLVTPSSVFLDIVITGNSARSMSTHQSPLSMILLSLLMGLVSGGGTGILELLLLIVMSDSSNPSGGGTGGTFRHERSKFKNPSKKFPTTPSSSTNCQCHRHRRRRRRSRRHCRSCDVVNQKATAALKSTGNCCTTTTAIITSPSSVQSNHHQEIT